MIFSIALWSFIQVVYKIIFRSIIQRYLETYFKFIDNLLSINFGLPQALYRHSGMLLARLRETTAWQAGIQVFGR